MTSISLPEQPQQQVENQQFAKPGVYESLDCRGRQCAKCGKCRDWEYTGDIETWKWIQNCVNWNSNDWKRWDNNRVKDRFKRRDGATCERRGFVIVDRVLLADTLLERLADLLGIHDRVVVDYADIHACICDNQ